MDLIRVFFFAAGLALVGWTLLSAVRTVVLDDRLESGCVMAIHGPNVPGGSEELAVAGPLSRVTDPLALV
jgi:hypothetical protein